MAEARACQGAARFFLQQGAEQIAAMYLQRAYQRYGDADATAQLEGLQTDFPGLLPQTGAPAAERSAQQRAAERNFLLQVKAQKEIIWHVAADAMALSDRDGTVIDANPAYLQLYGYDRAEVIGKNFAIIFPAQERAHAQQQYRNIFAGELTSMQFETQVRRADGALRTVDTHIEFIYNNGKRVAMLSIIRDITERKQIAAALEEHRQRYRLATQAAQVGVWDWDLQTGAFYLDPTVKDMLGYAEHEIPNDIEAWITYVHPDDAERVMVTAQQDIAGKTDEYKCEHRMIHKDGSIRWFMSRGTIMRDDSGCAYRMVGTDTDITARKHVELHLQNANLDLQKRNKELNALNQIAQAAATNTDLRSVLDVVTEMTTDLLDALSTYLGWIVEVDPTSPDPAQALLFSLPARVSPIEDDHLARDEKAPQRPAAHQAPPNHIPVMDDALIQYLLHQRRAVVIDPDQKRELSPHLQAFMRQLDVESLALIPLISRERLMGIMVIASSQPGRRFSAEELALAETIAGKVAGLVENAHLLYEAEWQRQRTERRNLELEAVLRVSREVASTLDLESLVNNVLDQLQNVVDYSIGTVVVVEDDEMYVAAYRGPLSRAAAVGQRYAAAPLLEARGPFAATEPWLARDLHAAEDVLLTLQELFGKRILTLVGNARSWIVTPMRLHGQIVGLLGLGHEEPDQYTASQVNYLEIFAQQAAVAIQNARLYRFARTSAVDEERHRLSRELHDAVTQTLFSANLIAEALPDAWQQSPELGRRGLHDLHQLTRSALAEMRTLLHELRPAALTQKRLADILQPLGDAVMGRAKVDFMFDAVGERKLPPKVQIAFYRIAQEALNNIFKHAAAREVQMSLHSLPDRVELQIVDDGNGFEQKDVPSDRLGLEIMRERAHAIGATLDIRSSPGRGTKVVLRWHDAVDGSE